MDDLTKFTPWCGFHHRLQCIRRAGAQITAKFRHHTLLPALALMMLATPAIADSIDGNWCHSDGRRFTIRGSEIVTPGGKNMEGSYSRHNFSYVAPAPEAGAGQTIFMTLANENTVQLRLGEAASTAETWVRCSASISWLTELAPSRQTDRTIRPTR